MTFEQFHNRIVICAELIAVTPIFIGARSDSYKPGAVNGACVRDAYGRPYIPGSSLKGVLRGFLSSIINKKGIDDSGFDKKEQDDDIGAKDLADLIYRSSSEIDHLFGSTYMAGKVKIGDALPKTEVVHTEVRNGVAIDRDTHTALSGALYDTEAIPSGTVFRFMASAENLSFEEAKWFYKLMQYFADGNISVGGRSRAGLGTIELRDIKVTVYVKDEDGFPVSKEAMSIDEAIKEVYTCLPN